MFGPRLPWPPERSTLTALWSAFWRCRTKHRCASCSASGSRAIPGSDCSSAGSLGPGAWSFERSRPRDREGVNHYLADGLRSTLDTGERVRMIGGLRAFQGEQSLSALLQVVREDPNPEVRTAALVAVGDLLDTEELLALGVRALGDPNLMVRRAAVDLFSKVAPEHAFPKLIRSLRPEEDPAVLAAAAELAGQHFPAFRDVVSAMPLEPDQSVLLIRLARFIHHAGLSDLLLPFSRSSWSEVREAVAELGRQRPDAMDPDALDCSRPTP